MERVSEHALSRSSAPPPRTHRRSFVLLANARASGVDRALVDAAASELRAAGAHVETRRTESVDHVEAALRDAEDRRVVLLGGDGSLHVVANAAARPAELALIPAGVANNVARSLGVPRKLKDAAELAVAGRARPFDLLEARAGERRYSVAEGVSVGFLAQARSQYSAPNSAAIGAGVGAGIRALRKFHPASIVLILDGRRIELTVAQVFVANTPLYAFGLRVAPNADVRDGLLDVVSVSTRGRGTLLALAPRVWRGTHVGIRSVRSWQAQEVRIDPLGWSPVVADSTNLGEGPVSVSVEPAGLRVVAP